MRKLPEIKKSIHPIYIKLGIVPIIATGIEVGSEFRGTQIEK